MLFLQGGASLQFAMCPMNFLPDGGTADYLMTGSWSKKAGKEAALFGTVHAACSSEADNFNRIPTPAETSYSESPRLRPLPEQQHDLRHAVQDRAGPAGGGRSSPATPAATCSAARWT